MKKTIMPYVAKTISSDRLLILKRHFYECKRVLCKQPHTLDVFIRVDDPYSFLLIQVIDDFLSRFNLNAQFHTTLELQADMYPAQEMWYEYAAIDAPHLADMYGLSFPAGKVIKDTARITNASALLIQAESSKNYIEIAKTVLHALWFDKPLPKQSQQHDKEITRLALAENDQLLKNMGHYFGAMIHYGGEWYWGIDRLDHLEKRLIQLDLAHNQNESPQYNRTYKNVCTARTNAKQETPFTMYWSARSPYSYIALERAVAMANYHQITLNIKPVLPMMMRGMFVPNTKKMYIFLDTKREAKKLGINYGFVADPLGDAVKRCYSLYEYAKQENKANAFLLSFGRAVNAQGIRADTDNGMKKIVERCGLDWAIAKPLLNKNQWEQWAQENLDEMLALGCWGVPSFHYKDTHVWGQDRLCIIENKILHDDA